MPDARGPKVGWLSEIARRGSVVQVSCELCPHRVTLQPAELIERLGDIALEALNQRLVCSQCGGRTFHLQVPLVNAPGIPGSLKR
ncbi:MAG TPA: hypothetical protein VJ890_11875 [Vineibacter sp.]|nr:hypothetical protein [Vineibacter sp.]